MTYNEGVRVSIDVAALRSAIYEISVRHDWANTTDIEDRTEEIAAAYEQQVASAAERLADAEGSPHP